MSASAELPDDLSALRRRVAAILFCYEAAVQRKFLELVTADLTERIAASRRGGEGHDRR